MSAYRILLVEDEKELASTMLMNLQLEGYEAVHVSDGLAALDKLRSQAFDLAILDIMLPRLDGLQVCETMRLEGNATPVLFLSARASGGDRIEGLKIGGDDYLTKPFHLEELLLRVKKLIARRHAGDSLSDLVEFEFGGNKVNFNTFDLVDHRGEVRVISKKEIMLLRLLLQRKDQVVRREEILEKIWGYDIFPTTRTIDNYIMAFRKYFEEDSRHPRYFHSVRGVGYRFTPGG